MRFVVLTILFAGVCLAAPETSDSAPKVTQSSDLVDSVGSLAAIIPAASKAAGGLEKIYGNTSKLAGIIDESEDPSPAMSSLAEALSGAIQVIKEYTAANKNISKSVSKITGNDIFNVDLLNLGGVKTSVDRLCAAEYKISKVFHDAIKYIGTSSVSSVDLSAAASWFEKVVKAKRVLIEVVNNLAGLSGTAFKTALITANVPQATGYSADGIFELAKALQNQINKFQDVDYSSMIVGLFDLAYVEYDLKDAILKVVNTDKIL